MLTPRFLGCAAPGLSCLLPIFWLLFLWLSARAGGDDLCNSGECCFKEMPFQGEETVFAGGPWDLLCYKVFPDGYECSWKYTGASANVTHFLRCCFGTGSCCYFKTGNAHSITFSDQDKVPVFQNVTFWVESHSGNSIQKSQNITVLLFSSVKFDPPSEDIHFSKSNSMLIIKWKTPEKQEHAVTEYRYRMRNASWEKGDCGIQEDPDLETCSIHFEKDVACEFQIRRQKNAHGGHWSNWSKSICIPAEIRRSPEVNYTVGKLENNGTRKLFLTWEKLNPELPEGCRNPGSRMEVNYTLVVHMLSCQCQQKAEKRMKPKTTLTISGAAYNFSVGTLNTIGPGPNQTYHVPPDAQTEIRSPSVNFSGGIMLLKHEVKSYCIEWYPQAADWTNATCALKSISEEKIPVATSNATEARVRHSQTNASGNMEPGKCYRIAVYSSDKPKSLMSWSTLFSTYHFSRDASKSGPSQIKITNITVDSVSLEWKPSPLSQCPGILKEYIIDCTDEKNNETRYFPVNASLLQYTLQNLNPNTFYRIQIRGDTATEKGAWSQPQRFWIHTTDKKQVDGYFFLVCLGIFGFIVITGILGYFGVKRVKKHLCPPVPDPLASDATKFPESELKLARQWTRIPDQCEEAGPGEPLVIEACLDTGEVDVNQETGILYMHDKMQEMKETADTKEARTGSEEEPPLETDLPFEYRRQMQGEPEVEDL
ncbi:interleukin-12 receptor subunit beta-1 [Tachyglossus aculeatus]|uniref:interleukin-12 receptor subunit beta-1 n=1 Tax=Tachyglossus aculeatus TaxID=9261 RepID=UPI0018F2E1AD|nr:interleukin-12 receptor subunit beta-1 [Tachyglossus aculeatus]